MLWFVVQLPFICQPEDVDAKAAEMISEAILNQLVHANWKERLAGIEALTEVRFLCTTVYASGESSVAQKGCEGVG